MIKAVVFDMGGVILDHRYCPHKAKAHAAKTIRWLEQYDVHIPEAPGEFAIKLRRADQDRRRATEEQLREIPPLEALCDYFLRDYKADLGRLFPIAEEFCFRWNDECFEAAPRYGLEESLSKLRGMGIRLGVISNTLSRTYMISKLADFGVSRYFEYVLLSSVCGLRKPDPAIFELCRTTMGLAKSEMAYVGDTISRDVIGAIDAGWKLMIRIEAPCPSAYVVEREQALKYSGYRPHHSIRELPEVVEVISSCCSGFSHCL